jgi:hypothetical protein
VRTALGRRERRLLDELRLACRPLARRGNTLGRLGLAVHDLRVENARLYAENAELRRKVARLIPTSDPHV